MPATIHYVTRFCACGYPLRIGVRWTGLENTFLVYDGAPEPRTNARLECCPSCALRLLPVTLLDLYRKGRIRRTSAYRRREREREAAAVATPAWPTSWRLGLLTPA